MASERGDEAFARALAPEYAQPAAGFVDRRKERQALDVIPVSVREKQGKIERLTLELGKQRLAEFAQPGSGVQDDDFLPAADFHAGGVSAITHCARFRRGNRAANAPKLDVRGGFDTEDFSAGAGKNKFE